MAERIDFEFMGTRSVALRLDPEEFRGMPVPKITGEILSMLRSLEPDVSFFNDDVQLAAEQLSASGS